MSSPLLWGPNNTSNNLQNQILLAPGQLLSYNGPKNYIANSSFENQLTTGYSLGTTGTLTGGIPTGIPTFGSGASGNLSIAIVTSGQLAGLASLSYASSAATTAGNMLATDAFTIDIEDQAKVLNISFAYKAQTNPGNANWSGTSSNSFAVAMYDVTNSAYIIPQKPFNLIQSTGVGQFTGSFQTSSSGTSYRLIIYNANATSGAATVYFDDMFVGPQSISSSQNIIEASYTNTSGQTLANNTTTTITSWTKVNDTTASFNATTGVYTVPVTGQYLASMSIGIVSSTSNAGVIQSVIVQAGSASTSSMSSVPFGTSGNTSTPLTSFIFNCVAGDTLTFRGLQTNTGGSLSLSTTAAFNYMSVAMLAPQPGSGAGGIVAAKAHVGSAASTTASNPINFDTVDFDTSGSITTGATTWKFTCPISGYYHVDAGGYFGAANVLLMIFKSGTQYTTIGGSASTNNGAGGGAVIPCNAGDTLDIRPGVTATPTNIGAPATLATTNYVSIFLVQASTPSNQGLPNVNARYFASATSISGSLATVSWTTKDYDSATGMSSGTYTIPITGKYQVNTALAISGTVALNSTFDLQLQKNGTVVSEQNLFAGGIETGLVGNISDVISCLAGDTIRLQVSTSVTGPSIVSSNSKNYFSIALVGQ